MQIKIQNLNKTQLLKFHPFLFYVVSSKFQIHMRQGCQWALLFHVCVSLKMYDQILVNITVYKVSITVDPVEQTDCISF